MNIIENKLPPPSKKGDIVAIDTEMFGLKKEQLHRPYGRLASMQICVNDDDVYMFYDEADVPRALKRIEKATWVFHFAQFDLTHLRRWADIPPRTALWDTMIIERIMFANYYDSFGLKDLARRYLDLYMEKETREQFAKGETMTDEMKHYAALDAQVTRMVALLQMAICKNEFPAAPYTDYRWAEKAWREVELPALWPLLELKPFPINLSKWNALSDYNTRRAVELRQRLWGLTGDDEFNPASPLQVKRAIARIDAIFLDNTGEESLKDISEQSELARLILEFRSANKKSTTYGQLFVDKYVEYEGKIPVTAGEVNEIGAVTGRSSSDAPNMQNLVAEKVAVNTLPLVFQKKHKPEDKIAPYRDCFESHKGYILAVGDFSQQELRVMALLSSDENMLDAFNRGADIHLDTAMKLWNDKTRRSDAKAIVFGTIFGLTSFGLANRLKISQDQAAQMLEDWFALYRGIQTWMAQQRTKPYVETICGRRFWMSHYTRNSQNQALNFPIQGSSAEMTKKALANLYACWPKKFGAFGLLNVVHDEIVTEAPTKYAKQGEKLLKECMEDAMKSMLGDVLPSRADISTGSSWACKT